MPCSSTTRRPPTWTSSIITDPTATAKIAEYDLAETFPQILQPEPANLTEVFFHDVDVKRIGGRQIMLQSYWDAGYVKIDISDPLAPRYLGDTDFIDPDHQLLEAAGQELPPEGKCTSIGVNQVSGYGDRAHRRWGRMHGSRTASARRLRIP